MLCSNGADERLGHQLLCHPGTEGKTDDLSVEEILMGGRSRSSLHR
jgi:hypothetical protein